MFCGETGEAWRSFAVIPMERAGPWEEARGWQSESQTEVATFGHEFSYLKGWLTDKPWLFRLGRLVDSSFPMKEWSQSRQEKQLAVLVASGNMCIVEPELELQKRLTASP